MSETSDATARPDISLVWECLIPDMRPAQERGVAHGFDIEQVRRATDIVALISESIDLRKAGTDYQARCPFHDEKTPSFTVSGNKQFYHCFGCGAHGSVFDWMMQYERMDFATALRALAGRAGIVGAPVDAADSKRRRATARHAQIEASAWHELLILEMAIGERVSFRGIDQRTLDRHPHLHAPPDGPDDRELLAAQRLSDALKALYGAAPGQVPQVVESEPVGRKTAAEKASEERAWLAARRKAQTQTGR